MFALTPRNQFISNQRERREGEGRLEKGRREEEREVDKRVLRIILYVMVGV